ncbi:U32 family peptidase [bacterium]|nr:U32 family peptidase [bacterium]
MKLKTIELMAPAGSLEALSAALNAGADSVYFGVEQLNMRSRAAKRFGIDTIPRIVRQCSDHGARSYLTLNTIVYDGELPLMRDICDAAKAGDVSAVIAADIAAIRCARGIGLPVHISTQANISNIEAVRFYADYADAVVLARELSLEQIRDICSAVRERDIRGPSGELIRIEVFVHGALCVSISGKCYMSLALTGHSANRGDCLQNCRRSYTVRDTETGDELVIDNRYVMSPADLCTVTMLDKLVAAGPSIFKIEGRGRAADYVHRVTSVYRKALDAVQDGSYTMEDAEQWEEELATVFNRTFWKNGYYLGNPLGEWAASDSSRSTLRKVYCGTVANYFRQAKIAEIRILDEPVTVGDMLVIIGETSGCVETLVESIYVDENPVQRAVRGERATVPVAERVRFNDKVYVLKER